MVDSDAKKPRLIESGLTVDETGSAGSADSADFLSPRPLGKICSIPYIHLGKVVLYQLSYNRSS